MDANRPAMTSACQVIDVCAVAQSGVACPAKHLFGRPSRASPGPDSDLSVRGPSSMLDGVLLRPEQEDLLVTLVEAERRGIVKSCGSPVLPDHAATS